MAQSAAVAGKARSKLAMRDIFEDPRIILMLALGFSSGLPLLLVLGTFSTRSPIRTWTSRRSASSAIWRSPTP